jgi:hypothetical protein
VLAEPNRLAWIVSEAWWLAKTEDGFPDDAPARNGADELFRLREPRDSNKT